MCNLYRQRSGPQAILDAANAMRSAVGNLAPGDVYPDYPAPIVEHRAAYRHAQERLFGLRAKPEARAEAKAVFQKHGSRKRRS